MAAKKSLKSARSPRAAAASAPIPYRLERPVSRRVSEAARHKFRIGESLVWQASPLAQASSRGVVTVVSHLPPLGNVLQYRIRHAKDQREFVVLEHELSSDGSPSVPTV